MASIHGEIIQVSDRGFVFIKPLSGTIGRDVFAHCKVFDKSMPPCDSRLMQLPVEFEAQPTEKGWRATVVRKA